MAVSMVILLPAASRPCIYYKQITVNPMHRLEQVLLPALTNDDLGVYSKKIRREEASFY